MDAQKKQKVLLGVVAVLALGAGTYYFVLRDSGTSNQSAGAGGPTARKQVSKKEDNKPARKATSKANLPKSEPTTVERKEREAVENSGVERKKKRTDKKEEKKKTIAPAA